MWSTIFWATKKYIKSLRRSGKTLLNGKIFGNFDSNHYHVKPETNLKDGVWQWKVSNNDDILYIVEKVLKGSNQW